MFRRLLATGVFISLGHLSFAAEPPADSGPRYAGHVSALPSEPALEPPHQPTADAKPDSSSSYAIDEPHVNPMHYRVRERTTGPARAAWFRDPDGNTLGLRQA